MHLTERTSTHYHCDLFGPARVVYLVAPADRLLPAYWLLPLVLSTGCTCHKRRVSSLARAIYRWTGVQECDGQRKHPRRVDAATHCLDSVDLGAP